MLKNFNMKITKNFDYLIYVGRRPKGKYTRIWYTHENVRPPMDQCEWALSFDYDEELENPRHMRFPNYVRVGAGPNLLHKHKRIKPEKILQQKKKFCAFVYLHDVPYRNRFFDMLSKYKKIDSPGRCRKNMPNIGGHATPQASKTFSHYHKEKVDFIRPYKFVVAFENASQVGYTTEKIYHGFLADNIPIYWGNPLVHRDFNRKRFINAHEVKGLSAKARLDYLVEKIIELDRNDDLYLKMLREPPYPDNKMPAWVDPEKIVAFFKKVFRI
jgi:hypothetical protein